MSYEYSELMAWNAEHKVYPMAPPEYGPVDYHRATIERWLWDNRELMMTPTYDIGAEFRREYVPGLRTVNTQEYDTPYALVRPDVLGDVTKLPLADGEAGAVICTETLEHVPNLFRAVSEIKRVLRPTGWAFLTAPFIWPTHDTEHYGDYWRITEQGWRFLFGDFESLLVTPIEMRKPARSLWGHVATWEVMGNGWENTAPTGYCVAGRKAA